MARMTHRTTDPDCDGYREPTTLLGRWLHALAPYRVCDLCAWLRAERLLDPVHLDPVRTDGACRCGAQFVVVVLAGHEHGWEVCDHCDAPCPNLLAGLACLPCKRAGIVR